MAEKKDFAVESGHWYTAAGEPAYTIIGKNGKERNTTLADARKLNLVPSVTTIIKCAAAPQLEHWKRTQVLLSSMTLPRIPGESSDDFIYRVEQDWRKQGQDAAATGTVIHGEIEKRFKGGVLDNAWLPWVISAEKELTASCGSSQWHTERSFSHPLGYAGKTDLHKDGWVVDVKTKDGELKGFVSDDHVMQVAAYAQGLGLTGATGGILFVRRDKPESMFVPIAVEKMAQGLAMFSALLAYHQAKTGYVPVF